MKLITMLEELKRTCNALYLQKELKEKYGKENVNNDFNIITKELNNKENLEDIIIVDSDDMYITDNCEYPILIKKYLQEINKKELKTYMKDINVYNNNGNRFIMQFYNNYKIFYVPKEIIEKFYKNEGDEIINEYRRYQNAGYYKW